uniref:Small ribosomal subunit protein uS3m n=1 Tax=Pneumocystis murina (strain B123) TaxID=1069680 RepID=M1FPY5_PNEMU|nr:hypothetical protein H905_mgp04 [Pneumocystis murina]AFR90421.1 hypothetical protein [Pneumocystis murina]
MKKIHYYSFNNSNILFYSSLSLRESQTMLRILKQFFKNINISNPWIKIQGDRLQILFYYYSEEKIKIETTELETLFSKAFQKKVQIKGIPLNYPYLDSQIWVNNLQETSLKEIQKKIQMFKNPLDPYFIPGKYLSGIHIQIAGRSHKNQKRSKKEEIFIGTRGPYSDTQHCTLRSTNGLRTTTVTLYSGL